MTPGSQRLVPLTMIAAAIAFAIAAVTAGLIVERPAWWQAVVPLAVLGGIAPMIYAVNIRVVPAFSRRQWRSMKLVRAQVVTMLAGAWLVFIGRIDGSNPLITAGSVLALTSGILFMANIATLFRQPAGNRPGPPAADTNQKQVDRLAIVFTRTSSLFLLFGLGVGVALRFWTPERGRWDLVWAHAMLVGFMLSMACGICYHVLSRWTGREWQALWPIRLHLAATMLALPLMLAALAFDLDRLFLVAGPLQALAISTFLVTIVPFVLQLPGPTRAAVLAAALFLLAGIGLGAWFAIDPAIGARLRLTHAGINLFGFTGLLISGVGYYLVPRFAGHPLRWPRLAWVQVVLLGGGVLVGTAALAFRAYGHVNHTAIIAAFGMVAAAFAILALMIAGAFFGHPAGATVSTVRIGSTPGARGRPVAG